jgi:hypothetical protein
MIPERIKPSALRSEEQRNRCRVVFSFSEAFELHQSCLSCSATSLTTTSAHVCSAEVLHTDSIMLKAESCVWLADMKLAPRALQLRIVYGRVIGFPNAGSHEAEHLLRDQSWLAIEQNPQLRSHCARRLSVT